MEELQLVWGWQPASYLFLGGMGAGAFIAAAALFLRNREIGKTVVNVSMWASIACLCVGLLLLVSELVNPLRGLMLWQSFSHFTSWMTFGAWIVFAAVIVFGLMALLTSQRFERWYASRHEADGKKELPELLRTSRLCSVLAVIGIALGVCVAVYTGLLLMSVDGVAFWQTPLLPLLFTVSALDTGVALVEIVAVALAKRDPLRHAEARLLEKSVVVLVLVEATVVVAFLASMFAGNPLGAVDSASFAETARNSAKILATGSLAPAFWAIFVTLGLVVPLVAAVLSLRGGDKSEDFSFGRVAMAGAACALIGGCALRFLVLMAGLHVDYVADTIVRLLL